MGHWQLLHRGVQLVWDGPSLCCRITTTSCPRPGTGWPWTFRVLLCAARAMTHTRLSPCVRLHLHPIIVMHCRCNDWRHNLPLYSLLGQTLWMWARLCVRLSWAIPLLGGVVFICWQISGMWIVWRWLCQIVHWHQSVVGGWPFILWWTLLCRVRQLVVECVRRSQGCPDTRIIQGTASCAYVTINWLGILPGNVALRLMVCGRIRHSKNLSSNVARSFRLI